MLFLVIFIPIAFFGAHLIQGKDWRDTISDITGSEWKVESSDDKSRGKPAVDNEVKNLENIIKAKDREIEDLKRRIEELEGN